MSWNVEQLGLSLPLLGSELTQLGKTRFAASPRADPGMPLPGIYPTEMCAHGQ